ncbi:MAG: zinc-binding dehydrogenase [Fimbriimonadaceae bacterium]|nr:zinc-binding dehydrogenase [Fimbriimonadaceae bacterium]
MLQAAITGARQASLIERPAPQAREHWAVVKITVAPMCTEYKAWLQGQPADHLGHEAVGEVVEVAQPGRVRVGDRVVVQPGYGCGRCRHCLAGDHIHCQRGSGPAQFYGQPLGTATYAQYLVKPDWLLSPIPDELSDELAGLALCGLGPSYGAFQRMRVTALDTVLITGLGPVGLGGVVNASFRGARVIGVDSNTFRRGLAERLGASLTLDPLDPELPAKIAAATAGEGVDAALDCAGALPAQRLLIDATRRRGQVTYVAEANHELPIRISPDLVRKGLTVNGSWHYNLNDYAGIGQVLQRSPTVAQMITHRFALREVQDAFATLAEQQTGKVLLLPWA